MGVTRTGQGWIRWLDNYTRARMWLMLDAQDSARLQFFDWPGNSCIVVRKIGFSGEKSYEMKR